MPSSDFVSGIRIPLAVFVGRLMRPFQEVQSFRQAGSNGRLPGGATDCRWGADWRQMLTAGAEPDMT